MSDQTSETTPDGLDVAAVRERVEAATEGPWFAALGRVYGSTVQRMGSDGFHADVVSGSTLPLADAEFIAHARTDIPALLSALGHANARIAELEARS